MSMKHKAQVFFFVTVVGVQLVLIFLYLRKQEILIGLTYDRQRNEQVLARSAKYKDQLLLTIQELQKPSAIKHFVQSHLGMYSLKLADARRLHDKS